VLVKLALPILAAAILATGTGHGALLLPALVGLVVLATAIVVFALLMRKVEFARQVGGRMGAAASWLRRLVRKPPGSRLG
jgi:hypothetical protein